MLGNDGIPMYVNTELDTDLDSVKFSRWLELGGSIPRDWLDWRSPVPAGFPVPIWIGGFRDALQADELGDDEPLFCVIRVLGTVYRLAAYPYQSSYDIGLRLPHWSCEVQSMYRGQIVGRAHTRDDAIANLIEYAKTVLSDGLAVIDCLNETDREFIRQAKEAGAFVGLENHWSESDKSVSIEVRNNLSTEEHPFRQGFRLSTYARPEGCHWGCWYYFDGLEAGGRSRSVDVDATKGFSVARLVEDAGTCDCCGKRLPVDEIETAGFANGTCKECNFWFHLKLRSEGWSDR